MPPRRSFPISSASSRAARGFPPLPATCWGCSAACPARVPSAVTCPRTPLKRAPGGCSARRARAPCRARERTGERRGIASSSRAARERGWISGFPRRARLAGAADRRRRHGHRAASPACRDRGGGINRADPLRGVRGARSARGRAAAALRRHLDRDHRADQRPLVPGASPQGRRDDGCGTGLGLPAVLGVAAGAVVAAFAPAPCSRSRSWRSPARSQPSFCSAAPAGGWGRSCPAASG